MTVQFADVSAACTAMTRDILYGQGIEVTIGSDFREYESIVSVERPSQRIGDPFNPDIQNFDPNEAFWLVARNSDGALIHTQASRKIEISNPLQDVMRRQTLASYLMKNFRNFPPPLPGVDETESRFRATPGAHKMSGTLAYHGEFWVTPEEGFYRGAGLAAVFSRTSMLEMLKRWDPDWIFGFILDAVAFKGFAARIGYMHLEPRALRWVVEGRDKPIDTFLAYLDRFDLEYLLDIPLGDVLADAA
jgi:hypothetical protein